MTSFEGRVLRLLVAGPMSKAELSRGLGQKQVSGPLHGLVRKLAAAGLIEFTLPDKPNSRLQKYRLTVEGHAAVSNLTRQGGKP